MEQQGLNSPFFRQERVPDVCSLRQNFAKVYRLCDTGQILCEISISAGLKCRVEIAAIADPHICKADAVDEQDEELRLTRRRRFYHVYNGASVRAVENCLEVCRHFPQTVVLGDVIDYCSHGALTLAQQCLFEAEDAPLCIPGNHEYRKQMDTGLPEKTPNEEKARLLEQFWPNDLHFAKRQVAEDLILLGLDNGTGHFWPGTLDWLRQELRRAEERGCKVLILQHIAFRTANSHGETSLADWGFETQRQDFSQGDGALCGAAQDVQDQQILDLIAGKPDTVKAVITGHYHSLFRTVLQDSAGAPTAIPQFSLAAPIFVGFCGLVHILKVQ